MKKLYTVILLGIMALSFTSCEDDRIASTLEGTWKGNMYISSDYRGRYYDATYTEITFLRDPYTYSSGSGYWVDYYEGDAPWEYVANHIDWKVQSQIIYIYFREEGTSIEIYDYHLNNNRFSGYINDYGNHVEFSLYNVARPYYDNYRWGYDSWYDGPYWTRGAENDKDSIKTSEKPRRFVRNPQ